MALDNEKKYLLDGEPVTARQLLDDHQRPSVLYRPDIGLDGNKYSVLYGRNLMEGCGGFGDTVAEAMADVDKNWLEKKVPTPNEDAAEKGRAKLARERAPQSRVETESGS